MSSTQASADNSKTRLRGDMYLRAEQRYREEAAAAQLTAIVTPALAPVYQPTASDGQTTSDRGVETVLAPIPVGGATEVVAITRPAATTSVIAARPMVDLTVDETVEFRAFAAPRADLEPQPVDRPLPSPLAATPAIRRQRNLRQQRTLLPAAVLSAVAIIATFGAALTLSPESTEPPVSAATGRTAPAATAASPRAPASVTTTATPSSPAQAPGQTAPSTPTSALTTGGPDTIHAAVIPTRRPDPVRSTVAPVKPSQPAIVRVARTSAAATASTPRALEGQIRITSTPVGARVTVDGIGWGQTPVTVDHLTFGTKTVRLTHDGYASQQAIVQISPDRPQQSVAVPLQRR